MDNVFNAVNIHVPLYTILLYDSLVDSSESNIVLTYCSPMRSRFNVDCFEKRIILCHTYWPDAQEEKWVNA